MRIHMRGAALIALLALTTACGATLEDARFSTGSSTIVADGSYSQLYTVNTDQGTISVVDPQSGDVSEIAVGLEPTRVARAGDRVLVTLRGERAIAVLVETETGLQFSHKIDTGAEPYGIVADESGDRFYVTASMAGTVLEYDAGTLELIRSFDVPDEPRWLALHPNGRALYVGSAFGGRVSWIDLAGEGAVTRVELPPAFRFDEEVGEDLPLTPRITGDPDVSADGRHLAFPVLYVDNLSRVVGGDEDGDGVDVVGGGYASEPTVGISRLNPTVVVYDLGSSGRPDNDSAHARLAAAFADVDGMNNMFGVVRSFPTSVRFSPNGMALMVTLEGSKVVVAVPAPHTNADARDMGGIDSASTVATVTATGPRGVAFLDDTEAYVHTFISRTVAEVDYARVQDRMAEQNSRSDRFGGDLMTDDFGMIETSFLAGPGIQVTEEVLTGEVLHGRNLFYSATDSKMVADGGGVSCSTCHLEGRNDGLNWNLTQGVRNTPSLAGQVSLKAPVTWTLAVDSVADEAMITSQTRMGGHGLTVTDAKAIETYVDSTRHADVALRTATDEAITRGQAIFEREDVACASCHNGPELTNNTFHAMAGEPSVHTPGLRGVSASPPYLHNGSLQSLRDVLNWAKSGEMGDTSMLSRAEIDDLEAYLKSL